QLGDAGRAWLTNAVQLGFIVGTLGSALANLPDVWSPRRLMMVSALAGGGGAGRWGGQRGRGVVGRLARAGARPALPHGGLHGRRLSAGDEDHGYVVSRGTRARHRHPRG